MGYEPAWPPAAALYSIRQGLREFGERAVGEERKYRAFVSYSHRDKQWGDWLHRGLERYRVPKRLTAANGREGPIPARLFPVFRDREELPSSADLGDQIRQALEQSAYLIVICSPNSAQSRWVNEEILTFKRMGRENRILAVIVDGEPIAADARAQGDGRENALLKLVAGLLGVGFDTLKRRDLEAASRRARIYQAVAGAMLLLTLLAGVAAFMAYVAAIAAERQRNDALIAQSSFLARDSRLAVRRGDAVLGMQLALDALPKSIADPNRPYLASAEYGLENAVVNQRERLVLRGHGGDVDVAAFSPDGTRILTASADKTARVWDAKTGAQIVALRGHQRELTSAAFSPDGSRIVAASADKTARVWDAKTGAQIVVLGGHSDTVWSAAFSPDGSRIVTASWGKTARVWRVPPRCQALIDAARAALPRGLSESDRANEFLEERESSALMQLYFRLRPAFAFALPAAGDRCE